MTRLTTKRLVLRAAREEDLAPLFAIFSDPRAMRYWSSPPHKNAEETRPIVENLKADGPRSYFVFDHNETVIGLGGVHSGSEIGYLLHPDFWGKGLASEALGAIISHFWATTDVPQITADVDPRNTGSVMLLTRLGFQVSGFARDTFCISGEWSDSVYFSLQRPAKASCTPPT
ncbi:acetyltransferase, GNAT family [Candidatus Rhodobacter oscarellae]|uniref:Acetyltransferase, GNAT family n=1 Tax=Candidatus Rhodobacter oscarellae TaxID=1675527 RepID=A0A0J9GT52_9RHOB|nr:GNAT family N-acetyltransferase [Candidatus Rhodobacter lobularis]KMW56663.1 acetyltransferase, GNAT family [Candidatus Rhodobacter lobularis]